MNNCYFQLRQINPQHTVPTLVDEDEPIWDSHAICAYIVGKYAEDDSLYPKDLLTRARVDQRLHFDSGVLFPALRGANVPIFQGKKEVPPERLQAISDAFDMLQKFLDTDEYLVGNDLTIADFCALCSVSTLRLHQPLDPEAHSKVIAWIDRLSQIPAYDDLIVRVSNEFTALLDQRRGTAEE